MTTSGRPRTAIVGLAALALVASACAGRKRAGDAPTPGGSGSAAATRLEPGAFTDPVRVYQRMGLLAEGGALPFVGNVAFFATPSPDSTHALVSISMAANALTFQRASERYRATYALDIQVRRNDTTVARIEGNETVLVGVFKETTRDDESIIAQRLLTLRPGVYALSVTVRDADTQRASTSEATLTVPRLAAPALSTPVAVLEVQARGRLDSLPTIVTTPRATSVFGRDSLVPLYLEGYAQGARFPLTLAVRSDKGATLWTDTSSIPRRGAIFSGIVNVPVSRLGLGVTSVAIWPTGAADTVRVPLFVSFGESLPVTTFEEMLQYLRFFTTPDRLDALRNAPPEQRAQAWTRFLAETDPDPKTPGNEGLRDYFQRVRTANERFKEEGPQGWATDRGMVFVAIGDPDQIYEQGTSDVAQRGRAQVWEYRNYGMQLVFIDQTGFGRWRLTTSSEADFQSILRRIQQTGTAPR